MNMNEDKGDKADDYFQMKKQLDSLRKRMGEIAKPTFEAGCKKFFKDFPKLVSFSWHQYTPYNDGDMTATSLSISTDDVEIDVDEDTDDASYKAIEKAVQDDFLAKFEEDDLVQMFDTEVEIVVTKEGIKVGQYYE